VLIREIRVIKIKKFTFIGFRKYELIFVKLKKQLQFVLIREIRVITLKKYV